MGFRNLEIANTVKAATSERKNDIWNALIVRYFIKKPLVLHRNAVNDRYINPLLCAGIIVYSYSSISHPDISHPMTPRHLMNALGIPHPMTPRHRMSIH